MQDCPIENYRRKIEREDQDFARGIVSHEAEIRKEIDAAFDFALSSEKPSATDAQGKVYA
jgi:pyruvate dehydrogenase E1 component alpha subunit